MHNERPEWSFFAECQRECHRNDPVCAEGQRIHSNADNRIKRRLSKEEAEKTAIPDEFWSLTGAEPSGSSSRPSYVDAR